MKCINIFISVLFVSVSYGQSLDSLIQMALHQNLEFKVVKLMYEVAKEEIAKPSLADPNVNIGIPIQPVETRLGGQSLVLSANQSFPWFGTLKTQRKIASSISESRFQQIKQKWLTLVYQIKTIYYQLYLLEQKQKIIAENIKIYQGIFKISLGKIESGSAPASDAIRINTKIDEFSEEIQALNNERNLMWTKLNELTNSPYNKPIIIKDSISEIKELQISDEEVLEKFKKHPLQQDLDNQDKSKKLAQQLNIKMSMPKMGVGINYIQVDPRIDANPIDNGRDILVSNFSLSIPLFNRDVKAIKRQLNHQIYQIAHQKKALTNSLITQYQEYKTSFQNAQLEIELYKKQIELIQSACNILLTNYTTEGKRFDEALQLQTQLLQLKLKLITSKVQMHISKAGIEKLINY